MSWLILAHSGGISEAWGTVILGLWAAVVVGFAGWLQFPDGTWAVRVSRALMAVGTIAIAILALSFKLVGY